MTKKKTKSHSNSLKLKKLIKNKKTLIFCEEIDDKVIILVINLM